MSQNLLRTFLLVVDPAGWTATHPLTRSIMAEKVIPALADDQRRVVNDHAVLLFLPLSPFLLSQLKRRTLPDLHLPPLASLSGQSLSCSVSAKCVMHPTSQLVVIMNLDPPPLQPNLLIRLTAPRTLS